MIPREAAASTTQASLTEALAATVRDGRQKGAIARQFAEVARLTESVRDRLTGDMYATFTSTLRWATASTVSVSVGKCSARGSKLAAMSS